MNVNWTLHATNILLTGVYFTALVGVSVWFLYHVLSRLLASVLDKSLRIVASMFISYWEEAKKTGTLPKSTPQELHIVVETDTEQKGPPA